MHTSATPTNPLLIRGIPTAHADALRSGAPDAHGQPQLKATAHGLGNPCRHCLNLIAEGDTKLILAYRPFDEAHATQLAN